MPYFEATDAQILLVWMHICISALTSAETVEKRSVQTVYAFLFPATEQAGQGKTDY